MLAEPLDPAIHNVVKDYAGHFKTRMRAIVAA